MKLIVKLVLALLVFVGIGCSKSDQTMVKQDQTNVPMEIVGSEKAAPPPASAQGIAAKYNFTLKDLDGKAVSLTDYSGKIVILDFWDTWCPPCRAEIPHFVDLQTKYKDKGVQFIGLALAQEGLDAVKKFVVDNKVNYITLVATDDVAKQYGGIEGIPTTFVMTPEGEVYKKYVGFTDKSVFEKDIEDLLNRKKS